jgi:uncharacterized protein (TIGR03435 family)
MPEFVELLMNFISDRQIVDETGLTGTFDFTMILPTSAMHNDQASDESDTVTGFFRALKTLGFRLVPKKAPIEVIVIDHLEKPSAN